MKRVQFRNGEVRDVTSRYAIMLMAKGEVVEYLAKEEKTEVQTKEEKIVPRTKRQVHKRK
jgi:hypothetical protein